MRKEGRLFNLRWFCLAFASLILGIAFASHVIAGIVAFIILIPIVILTFCKPRNIVAIIVVLAMYLLGFCYTSGLNYVVNNHNEYLETAHIEARVTNFSEHDVLGKVDGKIIIDDINVDGEKVGGKAVLYIGGVETKDIYVGDKMSFFGTLHRYDLALDDIGSATYYNDNVYYHVEDYNEGTYARGELKGREKLIYKVQKVLFSKLDEDTAGFIMGMMFGDTSLISGNVKIASKRIGIAHLFAVSGLHVGMIVSFLIFILSRCKVPKKYHLIILPFLFVYAYICGFSVSVLRATIMVTIYLIARACYLRYDMLSAISFAGIVLLLVNPMYLFDVSFVMSFLAVISIALYQDRFVKLFSKKSTKYLSLKGILATNIAVNIGLLPIMLYLFGGLSLLTIPVNFVVVPIVGLIFPIFILLFIFVMITHAYVLLPIVSLPFTGLVELSKWVASVNFLTMNFDVSIVFVIAYVILMIVVSKVVFIDTKVKMIPKIALVLVLIVGLISPTCNHAIRGNKIVGTSANGGYVVFFEDSEDRNILVISGSVHESMLDRAVDLADRNRAKGIYAIVVPYLKQEKAYLIDYYNESIGAKYILTYEDMLFSNIESVGTLDDVYIDKRHNVHISMDMRSVLLLNPYSKREDIQGADIVVTSNPSLTFDDKTPNHYINFAKDSQGPSYRDFTFYIKNDKINVGKSTQNKG